MARTDERGRAAFETASEVVELTIRSLGRATRYMVTAPELGETTAIVLQPLECNRLEVEAVDGRGTPVASAWIIFDDGAYAGSLGMGPVPRTDREGHLALEQIPLGRRFGLVTAPGFLPARFSAVVQRGAQAAAMARVVLEPETTWRVLGVDDDGEPAPFTPFLVREGKGLGLEGPARRSTDSRGRALLRTAARSKTLVLRAEYQPAAQPSTVLTRPDETEEALLPRPRWIAVAFADSSMPYRIEREGLSVPFQFKGEPFERLFLPIPADGSALMIDQSNGPSLFLHPDQIGPFAPEQPLLIDAATQARTIRLIVDGPRGPILEDVRCEFAPGPRLLLPAANGMVERTETGQFAMRVVGNGPIPCTLYHPGHPPLSFRIPARPQGAEPPLHLHFEQGTPVRLRIDPGDPRWRGTTQARVYVSCSGKPVFQARFGPEDAIVDLPSGVPVGRIELRVHLPRQEPRTIERTATGSQPIVIDLRGKRGGD